MSRHVVMDGSEQTSIEITQSGQSEFPSDDQTTVCLTPEPTRDLPNASPTPQKPVPAETSKATVGCCGLPVPRLRRSRKDTKTKQSGAQDKDELSDHPLNLAGITLDLSQLSVQSSGNHVMDVTDQEDTDRRLEEFKKLFCGGNALHCVDFIRIWGFYDKDHSGYLETKELDKFIKDLIQQKGQKPYPDMIKTVREVILRSADVNKDGRIELAEFSRCLPVENNFMLQFDSRLQMTRKEFYDIFCHYDPDKNGYIEGHEILALLRDILSKKGMNIGAQELESYREMFIKAYDKDQDGKLSRDELGMLLSVDK